MSCSALSRRDLNLVQGTLQVPTYLTQIGSLAFLFESSERLLRGSILPHLSMQMQPIRYGFKNLSKGLRKKSDRTHSCVKLHVSETARYVQSRLFFPASSESLALGNASVISNHPQKDGSRFTSSPSRRMEARKSSMQERRTASTQEL